MARLTQAHISKLRSGNCEVVVWDDDLPGFGIRVKPSGVKSFLIQYRNNGGRSRRLTLGRYGKLTPDEARKRAKKEFAAILDGADPAEERSDKRTAPTVADLADRFLSEYSAVHKKPSSQKEDRRLVEKRVKPALGRYKAADVTRADIAKLHHRLRETPFEANRTLALLSKMFNMAEVWGLRPDGSNPCRHMRRFKERKRERFFSADELTDIGQALDEAENTGTVKSAHVLAIRLLALTGCRVSEILNARWSDIDFKSGMLQLPDAKAGPRDVVLPAAAIALLDGRSNGADYLIANAAADKPVSIHAIEKAWQKIRENASLENARLHDFRHTFGTYGGQAGFNAFLVRDLLGQKTLEMTGRYVERDANPMKVAADQVSGRIAAALNGNKTAEVVSFPSKSERQGFSDS